MRSTRRNPMKLKIEGMTCGGCAKSVTEAIQSVDPNPGSRSIWPHARPSSRRP
ncbi:heavy-metal-associated domain-containing protein [Mesorhizobium sp. 1B3]|uniref:heavy-metal-associated domain-containing protein n=1 Tax=Mesorhizobium sp. 1B3 TaxID=3243599 RepID=UPI003D9865E0